MIGGLMKSTSQIALAAAAGLFVGAMAFTPAKAADLGGDCCADLEERVAELEATTVRKANRVVSVQIYGQVNKALVIWDDGIDSDLYMTDNDVSSSRFGLRGKGTIMPGWTAGYRFEFEVDSAASETVGQDDAVARALGSNGDDGSRSSDINVRRTSIYLESEQYGRVQFGKTSSATDDITLINLGGVSGSGQDNDFSQGFLIRNERASNRIGSYFASEEEIRSKTGELLNTVPPGGTLNVTDTSSEIRGGIFWGDIAPGLDLGRIDGVRYDTPSIFGFIASVAWGEDDFWDVGLRFSKEWNSIRVAAGIGYFWSGDSSITSDIDELNAEDKESLRGSISVMHTPSGLYGTFAFVQDEFDDSASVSQVASGTGELGVIGTGTLGAGDESFTLDDGSLRDGADPSFYYIQLGIARNWFGHGNTILYGEYGQYEDYGVGGVVADFNGDGQALDILTGTEATYWGFGAEQKFDSAALSLFANFKYYEADDLNFDAYTVDSGGDVVSAGSGDADAEDWYAIVTGAKIKF